MRPIEIRFRGDLPRKVMEDVHARYADWILEDDEVVDLSETPEWKDFQKRQTPGAWISGLRKAHGWTQKQLGFRLEGVTAARISDWEHDRRTVSKSKAKLLADLFGASADHFI